MAIIDKTKLKNPFIIDRDENTFIGIDLPFRVGDRGEGWGASTEVTLDAVKNNLKTYLSQYRILTDAINIKDAYIVNISCRFSIITQRGYNKNEVLLKAIESVKKYFDIQKWQIGQPIILSDIAYAISLVDGVASIVPPGDDNPQKQMVVIDNEYDTTNGYNGHVYDLQSATKDGIIYPSLDPSIFELKFPNTDIEGRVVGDV